MPIQIVEAKHSDLERAAKTGRVRSIETLQIITAIQDLKPGSAKAIVPERGETTQRLRAKLSYAARIAGVKLRVVNEEKRVLFALRAGTSLRGRSNAAERKQAVQQKALQLGKNGKRSITAEDVIKALKNDNISLDGIERPATMIGAILRNMREFERTGRNAFRYRG